LIIGLSREELLARLLLFPLLGSVVGSLTVVFVLAMDLEGKLAQGDEICELKFKELSE